MSHIIDIGDSGVSNLERIGSPQLSQPRIPPPTDNWSDMSDGMALSTWEWLFDAVTVCLSISSNVCILLVMVELAVLGHSLLFACAVSVQIVSNWILTFTFLRESLPNFIRLWRSSITRAVILFPVAQLTPFVYWLRERRNIFSSSDVRYFSQGTMRVSTQALLEELDRMAAATGFVEGLERTESRHKLFFLETKTTSIPQLVLQFIFVVWLRECTVLQQVLVVLLILSIASRAHAFLFLHAFTIPMSAFKALAVSQDVFCAAFLILTYFSKDERCGICAVWVMKEYFTPSIIAIGVVVYGTKKFAEQHHHISAHPVGAALLLVFLTIVLFVPGLAVLEVVKLYWLVFLVNPREPDRALFTAMCTLFHFCHNGDYKDRLRFALTHEAKNDLHDKSCWTKNSRGQTVVPYGDNTLPAKVLRICYMHPFRPNDLITCKDVRRPHQQANVAGFCGMGCELGAWWASKSATEKVLTALAGIALIAYTITNLLILLLLPFITVRTNGWASLNVPQQFCLVLQSLSLLLFMCLLPHAYRYVAFIFHTSYIAINRTEKALCYPPRYVSPSLIRKDINICPVPSSNRTPLIFRVFQNLG